MNLASLQTLQQAFGLRPSTRDNIRHLNVYITSADCKEVTADMLSERCFWQVWHSFLSLLPKLRKVHLHALFEHGQTRHVVWSNLWQAQDKVWSAIGTAGSIFEITLEMRPVRDDHIVPDIVPIGLFRPLNRLAVSKLNYIGPLQYLEASVSANVILSRVPNPSTCMSKHVRLSLSNALHQTSGPPMALSPSLRAITLRIGEETVQPFIDVWRSCAPTLQDLKIYRACETGVVSLAHCAPVLMPCLVHLELSTFGPTTREVLAAVVAPSLVEFKWQLFDSFTAVSQEEELHTALRPFVNASPSLRLFQVSFEAHEKPGSRHCKAQSLRELKSYLRPQTRLTLDIVSYGPHSWVDACTTGIGGNLVQPLMENIETLHYRMLWTPAHRRVPEPLKLALPRLRDLTLSLHRTEDQLHILRYVLDTTHAPFLEQLTLQIWEGDSTARVQWLVPLQTVTGQILAILSHLHDLRKVTLDLVHSQFIKRDEEAIVYLERSCLKHDIIFSVADIPDVVSNSEGGSDVGSDIDSD